MSDILEKKKRLEALKDKRSLWPILNEACEIIGNPILIHDMEYKVIAYSENRVDDDPIWNEYVHTGTVGSDWLEFFKDEFFLDAAANTQKITFLLSDKLKYDRLFGKLFTNHNNQVGCACMVACHRPFADYDLELFEDICDVLNEKFCNSRYYQRYGQEILEKLISMLIEEKITDRLMYTAYIESIYAGLKNNLYLAVVDISQCDPTFAKLNYFRALFKRLHYDYKCAIYGNHLLIIMSMDSPKFNKKIHLQRLAKHFSGNNMLVGISSCFENLFELSKYYKEALSAIKEEIRVNNGGYVFLYDDIAH